MCSWCLSQELRNLVLNVGVQGIKGALKAVNPICDAIHEIEADV